MDSRDYFQQSSWRILKNPKESRRIWHKMKENSTFCDLNLIRPDEFSGESSKNLWRIGPIRINMDSREYFQQSSWRILKNPEESRRIWHEIKEKFNTVTWIWNDRPGENSEESSKNLWRIDRIRINMDSRDYFQQSSWRIPKNPEESRPINEKKERKKERKKDERP